MPVSALELVKKLMAKAGITTDGELTNDISDELATRLDNSLLTIAAATNNHPQVKRHYFGQAFKGLDQHILDLMDEYNLPDEAREEIERLAVGENGEKVGSSTKKVTALVKKINELSAKAAPADSGKAAQLNQQITDLNAKLAAEIKKQSTLKTEYDNQLKQIRIQTKLASMLTGYKTKFDDLDPDAKEPAITAIINKALNESEAEFTFDEKGHLSLVKKDGSSLFGDNHTVITPQSFLDKSLSKILKVSGPAQANPPATTVPGGTQSQPNTALKAAVAESLNSYTEAAKAVAV